MALTKREALEKCILMWTWLRDNPTKEKEDYLLFIKDLQTDIPRSNCYACQFAFEKREEMYDTSRGSLHLVSICYFCPIWSEEHNCEEPYSPYIGWLESNDKIERARYALSVVNLAQEKLKEILHD